MAAVEDTSDPSPPDIRPCRIRANNDYSVNTSRRPRRHWWPGSMALVALAVLALLPIAGAQDVAAEDAVHVVYKRRPTPILSLLKATGTWAWSFASPQAHTTDHATHSFAKRQMDGQHIAEACMIPVLVALSGVFAGLTLGYFSVDQTQLQVLSMSGTPKQQECAHRIIPVRKNSHLLLTTLILGNMIVNEALPVITDGVLGGGIQAVVISTALVVIFAEIIPQSVCSRYGLVIGATMAPVVKVLMWFFFPIAWPVAKLLEYILGAHHGIIYRRSELRELIKMHAAGGEGGGDLDIDTVTMAQGALDLAQKTVKDAMTKMDDVFMLPIEAKLDYETLGQVVRSGHSRIPVYQMVEVPDINLMAPASGPTQMKKVKRVIGCMLVKSCVLLDPEDATPLSSIPINSIPSVPWNEPLTNMHNAFQDGRSHMALVSRRGRAAAAELEDAESIMTAAAGGLKTRIMRKVAEISHGGRSNTSASESGESETDIEIAKTPEKERRRSLFRRKSVSSSSPTSSTAADKIKQDALEEKKLQEELNAENLKKLEDKKNKPLASIGLTQLEQAVPADAELPPDRFERFLDGLEGEALGIITLEDVLEELIGEEIYDEYDENGGPRNPASVFVPQEAAQAERKAKLARENAAKDKAAKEKRAITAEAAPAPAVKKLLPIKFNLGRRPASQPGRSRTAPEPEAARPPSPTKSHRSTESAQAVLDGRVGEPPKRVGSAPAMDAAVSEDPKAKTVSFGMTHIASAAGTAAPTSAGNPAAAKPALARLASSPDDVAAQPNAPNLLEALVLERRRRLATQRGESVPPSTIRTVAPLPAAGPLPIRQPIPLPPGSAIRTATPAGGRRTPKFKSNPIGPSGSSAAPVSGASEPKSDEPMLALPKIDTNIDSPR